MPYAFTFVPFRFVLLRFASVSAPYFYVYSCEDCKNYEPCGDINTTESPVIEVNRGSS